MNDPLLPTMKIPRSIGFIMDGNRRFAKEQGSEVRQGHEAGKDTFFEVVKWVRDAGIQHAVFYAFSTENWKRTTVEVSDLMAIFKTFIRFLHSQDDDRVAFKIVGQLNDFPGDLQEAVVELEAKNPTTPLLTVHVLLSYGGRTEILQAVNRAIVAGEPVDEAAFQKLLWTSDMPDPDLIIRTGGDMRLSNFLPWQSVYSELMFTPTLWPAFTKEEFTRMLQEYGSRERRLGA